jgi:hypothetical protein
MPTIIRSLKAQAMVETAFAIPILVLLFAGCVQMIQIGIAHIVVMEAAYEANRQLVMDAGNPANAQRVAAEICRSLSSGPTVYDKNQAAVTHQLKSIFPIVKQIKITHVCSPRIFQTEETPAGAAP